jgi:putative hydrolase of the HAD superfamily
MPIEAVLFDAAGTLIHLPRGVGFHYAEVARRHGVALDAQETGRAFASTWQAMPSRARVHGPRADDDRGWWQRLVYETLDRLRAPEFDRAAYFDELYREFTRPGVWEPFPEVREVLSALASRVRLGIVSNFDQRLLPILDGLGLSHFFEHVIISSAVGADKPDPAIFRFALARIGIDADRACHVGDHPVNDWRAAREAGLQVFELDRPTNDLRLLLEAPWWR